MAVKINKLNCAHLRNDEHVQMIKQTIVELAAHNPEELNIKALYDKLVALSKEEAAAYAVEHTSTLTAARNAADTKRDRLHSAVYNHVKALTFLDQKDDAPTLQAGLQIMQVIKQAGNPWELGDQAETTMLERLETDLKPLADVIEASGTKWLLDKLIAANKQFIELDKQYRDELSAQQSGNVKAVRKKINPVYADIINILNADITRFSDNRLDELAAALNVIVKRYSTIIAQRKGRNSDDDGGTPGIENPPPRG